MSISTTWIQGQLGTQIDVTNRGFLYGDGFFTTLAIEQGQPVHWDRHTERLCHAARTLWQRELSETELQSWHQEIRQCATGQSDAARISISRQGPSRGYLALHSPLEKGALHRVISTFVRPQHYAQWNQEGIDIGLAKTKLGKQDPRLAGIKTLNRLEQVMIKEELREQTFHDLLVLDLDGYVIEASAGNVFWRQGQQWYTPDLTYSGIHGIIRELLLEQAPQVQLVQARVGDLEDIDEMFVCNSLMGQVSIKSFLGKPLPRVRYYSKQSFLCPQLPQE